MASQRITSEGSKKYRMALSAGVCIIAGLSWLSSSPSHAKSVAASAGPPPPRVSTATPIPPQAAAQEIASQGMGAPETAPAKLTEGFAITESSLASEAALKVLARGGSACDAAISASLHAGISHPSSSGLGGGLLAVVFQQKDAKVTGIDARESAPSAAKDSPRHQTPGHFVGVPGEVMGLASLHQLCGKLDWKELWLEAADKADAGVAKDAFIRVLIDRMAAKLTPNPTLQSWLLPRQEKPMKNPKLAGLMRDVAELGPDAFYRGEHAKELVRAVKAAGGLIEEKDLERYKVILRPLLKTESRLGTVYSLGAPSAGGLMLHQMLRLFPEGLNWSDTKLSAKERAQSIDLFLRASRLSLIDRWNFSGDPSFSAIDYQKLLDEAWRKERRESLELPEVPAQTLGEFEHGTHHLIIRDSSGNVVSLTTTINGPFGSGVVVPETGLLLNDQLLDFSETSDAPAKQAPTTPNLIASERRPVSSMTPTLVIKDGKAVMAIGGSGGMNIATNVSQIMLRAVADPKLDASALSDAGRVYLSYQNSQDLSLGLAQNHSTGKTMSDPAMKNIIGELLQLKVRAAEKAEDLTAVQLFRLQENGITIAADPRKHGKALIDSAQR